MAEKTWGDFHREAVTAGMDDASACLSADKAMEAMEVHKPSYLEALTEIQRIAANGILSSPEGTDTWNLFADIHQQVCMAVGMKPDIVPGDPMSDRSAFYTSQKSDWRSIHSRPLTDDPMWFCNSVTRIYQGPRGAEPYDADNFDYWAPCTPPPFPKPCPPHHPITRFKGEMAWKECEKCGEFLRYLPTPNNA